MVLPCDTNARRNFMYLLWIEQIAVHRMKVWGVTITINLHRISHKFAFAKLFLIYQKSCILGSRKPHFDVLLPYVWNCGELMPCPDAPTCVPHLLLNFLSLKPHKIRFTSNMHHTTQKYCQISHITTGFPPKQKNQAKWISACTTKISPHL